MNSHVRPCEGKYGYGIALNVHVWYARLCMTRMDLYGYVLLRMANCMGMYGYVGLCAGKR